MEAKSTQPNDQQLDDRAGDVKRSGHKDGGAAKPSAAIGTDRDQERRVETPVNGGAASIRRVPDSAGCAERCTALGTKNSGGERRVSIRLHMPFGSGGTRDPEGLRNQPE